LAPRVTGKAGKKTGKLEYARSACDVTKNGSPDFYNGVAKRIVTEDEARRMGWACFYEGKSVCPRGHLSARYTSNPSMCTDCRREAEGKPAIYPMQAITDDLTGPIQYVDPVANDKFDWTPEKKRQFLTSWINRTSIPAALTVVKAQPIHLLDVLEHDSEFKAEYEAAERKVSLVQQWSLESEAVDGSDRVKLAMAGNKFASFGAKTGLAGRPIVNAEEERAEFAQVIQSARGSLDQRERLAAVARSRGAVAQSNTPSTPAGKDESIEPAVLGPPHDNSDLVSDLCPTCGLPKADAPLCCGCEV
jgi:hypothetical protein